MLLIPIFYLFLLLLGLFAASLRIIKDEVIATPRLKLNLQMEGEGEWEKREFYLIRWEKQKIGSIVTKYKIFIKNEGSRADLSYIIVKKPKLNNNFANLSNTNHSTKKEQEDSIRIVCNDILIRNESAHIATLNLVVTSDTKTRPGHFFQLPIIFGAFNAKEKEAIWKFKYKTQKI